MDAGFSARPPPTLRAWPAPDGAHALRHERAPALRSVPPAVGLVRVRFAAARGAPAAVGIGACGGFINAHRYARACAKGLEKILINPPAFLTFIDLIYYQQNKHIRRLKNENN